MPAGSPDAWSQVRIGIGTTIQELAADVRTIPVSPAIAATAAALPAAFPGDPVDRIIYATAVEQGWPLVTRDE